MPNSKNHSPGTKWRSNIQYYPQQNMRYDVRNKNRLYSIPSDKENASEGQSLPPLAQNNKIQDRRSVRDGIQCQSLEVDKLRMKKLNESIDVSLINVMHF